MKVLAFGLAAAMGLFACVALAGDYTVNGAAGEFGTVTFPSAFSGYVTSAVGSSSGVFNTFTFTPSSSGSHVVTVSPTLRFGDTHTIRTQVFKGTVDLIATFDGPGSQTVSFTGGQYYSVKVQMISPSYYTSTVYDYTVSVAGSAGGSGVSGGGGIQGGGNGGGGAVVQPVLSTEGYGAEKLTYQAAVLEDGALVAAMEVKTSKANKMGQVTVSGNLLLMNGRKVAFKGTASAADAVITTTVKGAGALELAFGDEGVTGTLAGASVEPTTLGGVQEDGTLQVLMTNDGIAGLASAGYLTILRTSEDAEAATINCLPAGTAVTVASGKWGLPKAGKITYNAKTGILNVADVNPSGLKLAYTPKTGAIKGSFNLYGMSTGKLKKTSVKVTGYVINGIGYGFATVKGLGTVALVIK